MYEIYLLLYTTTIVLIRYFGSQWGSASGPIRHKQLEHNSTKFDKYSCCRSSPSYKFLINALW